MPRRSPLTRVTPALSMATSVPVPMAMPTSAWASAGASLMPSPTIATTAALGLELLDRRRPSARAAPRRRPRRCRGSPATASAVVRLSPVSMTTPQALACSAAIASGVVCLDRVGDAEQAGGRAVDGDEHDGLAFAAQLLGALVRARAASTPSALHQARLPSATRAAVDRRPRPPCRSIESKSSAWPSSRPRSLGALDDRLRQRVLAAPLEAGRQPQQPSASSMPSDRLDA